MLVPIAHASNGSGSQKGFLASLCTGNKIVFVEFGLPTDNTPQPTLVASNKCPLCNIIAQDPPSDAVTPEPFSFEKKPHQFGLAATALLHSSAIRISAIRAPPAST